MLNVVFFNMFCVSCFLFATNKCFLPLFLLWFQRLFRLAAVGHLAPGLQLSGLQPKSSLCDCCSACSGTECLSRS